MIIDAWTRGEMYYSVLCLQFDYHALNNGAKHSSSSM